MNKFEEVYKKLINEEKIIKETVDENSINEAVKKLESVVKRFVLPGAAKKIISEVIVSLKSSENSANDEFREVYVGQTDDGKVKATICKDSGENDYYFILDDDFDLNGKEWRSYDNYFEFEFGNGTWETYEECLEEFKNTIEGFWDITFDKMKKQ